MLKRNFLRAIIVMVSLILGFFLMTLDSVHAQNNSAVTLQMLVERTYVDTSFNDSPNVAAKTVISIEEVTIAYPMQDVIVILTAQEYLELEMTSVVTNLHYFDRNNKAQYYTVTRERVGKGSFYYVIDPNTPFTQPNMYRIKIEPYLPYSRSK